MKPSERIQELISQGQNRPLQPVHNTLSAIIQYLDEQHRFEHPDLKAECARIAALHPEVLSLSAQEKTVTSGCPEEGMPFVDEDRLVLTITFHPGFLKDEAEWRTAYKIAKQIEEEICRFSKFPIRSKFYVAEVTA